MNNFGVENLLNRVVSVLSIAAILSTLLYITGYVYAVIYYQTLSKLPGSFFELSYLQTSVVGFALYLPLFLFLYFPTKKAFEVLFFRKCIRELKNMLVRLETSVPLEKRAESPEYLKDEAEIKELIENGERIEAKALEKWNSVEEYRKYLIAGGLSYAANVVFLYFFSNTSELYIFLGATIILVIEGIVVLYIHSNLKIIVKRKKIIVYHELVNLGFKVCFLLLLVAPVGMAQLTAHLRMLTQDQYQILITTDTSQVVGTYIFRNNEHLIINIEDYSVVFPQEKIRRVEWNNRPDKTPFIREFIP